MRKRRNDAELMRDRARAPESLLAAQDSKLAQKLADIQKHIFTIHKSLPNISFKLSSDIQSEFQEFRRCLFDSARKNVKSYQRGFDDSFTETLILFNISFKL